MWLGFSAAFIGIAYALIKFATLYRLRSLQEELAVVKHHVDRNHQRLEALHERLEMKQSRRRTVQRDVEELDKANRQLYTRLQTVLPQAMQPQLNSCLEIDASPDSQDVKLLAQLDMMHQVADTLEPLSILLINLPSSTDIATETAIDRCVDMLRRADVRFYGPEKGCLACFLPEPVHALPWLHHLLNELSAEDAARVNGALHTGVHVTAGQSDLKHLLAHSLHRARRLLDQAPAGTLLLNEAARKGCTDAQLELADAVNHVYAYRWDAAGGYGARTPKATT